MLRKSKGYYIFKELDIFRAYWLGDCGPFYQISPILGFFIINELNPLVMLMESKAQLKVIDDKN